MRTYVIISLMFLGVDFCSDDFSILSFATEEGSRVLNFGDTKFYLLVRNIGFIPNASH